MVFEFFEEHNKLSWFITAVGFAGSFIISSLVFAPSGLGIRLVPILYHIISFFLLSVFLFISVIQGKQERTGLFWIGIFLLLGYAILDELHQFFVPGRHCTAFDVFLDSVGILFGFMVYCVRLGLKRQCLSADRQYLVSEGGKKNL